MRTIGIRNLKAELSRVLRDVQDGERYLVTDRGRVVAELRTPADAADATLSHIDQVSLRLAAAGVLRLAERPRVDYRALTAALPVRSPDGTAQEAIDWTRGDR